MVVALIVPVIANGLRAFGTIYAAYLTSVEQATGMDHIVYGWVFFGLVMAAVIAIGWRWFDRAPDAPVFDPATLQRRPARRIDALLAAALRADDRGACFPPGRRRSPAVPRYCPTSSRCRRCRAGIARR